MERGQSGEGAEWRGGRVERGQSGEGAEWRGGRVERAVTQSHDSIH